MLEQIIGTFIGRWYVSLFGITFLVLAVRHLGWKKTGIYAVAAMIVGGGAENLSVHTGFPYTEYVYNQSLRGKELFLLDVPLMVALSYMFMSYFAFASARLIVSGPYRTRSRMPVLEFTIAVMLGVWASWVVDPMSRLGEHFFLGDLWHYTGNGFWFGLPLASQLGFALTGSMLVGVLFWLTRDEENREIDSIITHPHGAALGGYLGQVLFMAGTGFYIARTNSDPAVVKMADSLTGTAFLIGIPSVLCTAAHWRSMTLARRDALAAATVDVTTPPTSLTDAGSATIGAAD